MSSFTDFNAVLGFNNWTLTLMPHQPGQYLGVGYMVMSDLEVGANLGMNFKKADKAKTEESSNVFGLYGIYTLNLGKPKMGIRSYCESESGINKKKWKTGRS